MLGLVFYADLYHDRWVYLFHYEVHAVHACTCFCNIDYNAISWTDCMAKNLASQFSKVLVLMGIFPIIHYEKA